MNQRRRLAASEQNRSSERSGIRVRASLFGLLGKDVTAIDCLGPYLSLKLIAECGDDLTSWPNASTLLPGWGWRRAIRSPGAKCSRHQRAGPAVGPQLFCALLPNRPRRRPRARRLL